MQFDFAMTFEFHGPRMVRCALDMTQRANIIIVVVVALIALVLWSVPRFLPEPEAPVTTPAGPESADDGPDPGLPDTPIEAPERPDFSSADTQTGLSDASRSNADGLYRDLKSAADSIGDARDKVRLPVVGTLTLETPKRAEDETVEDEEEATEPEPEP